MLEKLKKIKSDVIAGFATAVFSIPEGMAYAKLAGVNPIYGLYSGIVATIAAAMTTGTVLMVSTVTSAIAVTTHSVLNIAGIEPANASNALFTLTFLVGIVMLTLGLFRLGRLIDFVSNAVMTGFLVGVSVIIIVGELGNLVGIAGHQEKKIVEIFDWIKDFHHWDPNTCLIGFGSIVLMLLLRALPKIKEAAALIVLLTFTLVVYLNHWDTVVLISGVSSVANSLPSFIIPDFSLMPRLAVGAVSVTLVALTQGTAVSTAIPNPDGSEPSHSRDFVGEGIGNIAGSFFQSMGTGGSLSRTAISVGAGARSRLAGVSSGFWLIVLVLLLGRMIEHIPVASIAGVLCVIAGGIIHERSSDIKLIVTTSLASTLVMVATFLASLFIPLQWAIFLGAALSLLFFVYTSATKIRLVQWVQTKEGYFMKKNVPKRLSLGQLIILDYEGNCFFGEVPAIKKLMPSTIGVHGSVIIWRMRGCEDVHSTFLKWLKRFVEEFHSGNNQFMLEGVEPHVMKQLKKTSIIESIGKENVFPAHPGIFVTLNRAIDVANQWISKHS